MKPYYKYIAAAIAALVILRSLTKSNFKKKLAKLANEELKRWNNGSIKEGNASLMPALRNYWKIGSKTNASDNYYIGNAWSATFVSYLMRQAGAGDKWKYSALHSDYIQAAKQNRKNNIKTFQAFRKNEVPVSVGDLICYPRTAGVTYDTTGGYYAHCDIVTNIDPGTATAVGGNVSDSVKESFYKLDSNNKVITDKVHAVIKTLI
jgi:hypothetical protein